MSAPVIQTEALYSREEFLVVEVQTITHVHPPRKSPLHLECTMRALRHSVWVSLYLAQDLALHGEQELLTRALRDIDRLLADLELVA